MMSLWNLTSPRQNNSSGSKRNDETPLTLKKKSYIHTWVMDNGENTHRNYILNI